MNSILLTGGIGDVFVLESMLSPAERDSLDTIYWATTSANSVIPLFKSSKRYGHVKHVVYPVTKTYFMTEGVRKDFPDLPADVLDWSIMVRFGEFSSRPYYLSTFLVEPSDPLPFDLPKSYVLIQHQTPDRPREQRAVRDLDQAEWGLILDRLEKEDKYGVIVNGPAADQPPVHPRLNSLVGKTTYSQTIALLKRASGYWGIASSLCCLASQLFEAKDLWVKGPEAWLRLNRYVYFAPHTEFSFLFNHLSETRPFAIDKNMQTIKMLITRIVNTELVGPGSIISVPIDQARLLIGTLQAEAYVAQAKTLREATINQEFTEARMYKKRGSK
jgi:hypothetical protein